MDASNRVGKPLAYDRQIGTKLEQAGFVDIQEMVLPVPLNAWPSSPDMKNLGRWYNLGMIESLETLSLGPLCRVLNWPINDVMEFLKLVKKDINSKAIHSYTNMYAPPRSHRTLDRR